MPPNESWTPKFRNVVARLDSSAEGERIAALNQALRISAANGMHIYEAFERAYGGDRSEEVGRLRSENERLARQKEMLQGENEKHAKEKNALKQERDGLAQRLAKAEADAETMAR